MNLSFNILLAQLRDMHYETYIPNPCSNTFSSPALLPRDYKVMRYDLIHICRLSDAMRAATICPGMNYICIRDRIRDDSETEDTVRGMVIINENMDVELLFYKIQDIFVRVNHWYQKMQDALICEGSLQDILNLSGDIIGNTINISDSAFTLLACTHSIETDDTVSLHLRQFGYHPESTLRMFREQRRLEAYNKAQSLIVNDSRLISPYILVSKVFRFRNTYFTHVVMVCDHHPLSEGLLELFQLLTDILAVYAERNWKDKNAFSHNYDSFFLDLLVGSLTKPEDILERAKYLGIDARGYFLLVKLAVSSGMEALLGRIGRELTEVLPGCQVVLYKQAALILFHIHGCQNSLDSQLAEVEALADRYQARGGVSNSFVGLENLCVAYNQASLALKYNIYMKGEALLNSLMPPQEAPLLCAYQNRMLHILLGEYPGNEVIWRNSIYYEALKALHDYDVRHNTNNLQLLRVYLWYERKATETGQHLHMHRNNVIYRISRIESMMGLDLNDYSTRLALQMSFVLLELYGFPKEEAENRE